MIFDRISHRCSVKTPKPLGNKDWECWISKLIIKIFESIDHKTIRLTMGVCCEASDLGDDSQLRDLAAPDLTNI